ncbi:MAG: kelch repeat-containing protein [Myxococcota bacterium]
MIAALWGCQEGAPSGKLNHNLADEHAPPVDTTVERSATPVVQTTGSLRYARAAHATARLTDGRVLVIGGAPPDAPTPSPSPSPSAAPSASEIFDPSSGTFSIGAGLNADPCRAKPIAVSLPDGRVLVAGGTTLGKGGTGGPATADAELWDPRSERFLSTGPLLAARAHHSAILLDDGRVFIAGGSGAAGPIRSAEIFDPTSGRFSAAGELSIARNLPALARLPDGRVLILGGGAINLSTDRPDIFDPKTGRFSLASETTMRTRPAAVALNDGRVLIAGGATAEGVLRSAEVYDATRGTFTRIGDLAAPRASANLTVLPQGDVLVTSGDVQVLPHEIFDPLRNTFRAADTQSLRRRTSATKLLDGRVLLLGGGTLSVDRLNSAELFLKLPDAHNTRYGNGGVMQGTPNIYYIWYGSWPQDSTRQILVDFAKGIGGTPYYNINTSYGDLSGRYITGRVKFAGQTSDSYSHGASLSEVDIQDIVAQSIRSHRLPKDSNGIYFVLTSADVKQHWGDENFCQVFCGWHWFATIDGTVIKYSFVGDPTTQCPNACSFFQTDQGRLPTPNDDFTADTMASVLVHEMEETHTDPQVNAWRDENADNCAWFYGYTEEDIYRTANGAMANVHAGNRDFLVQWNWVNASDIEAQRWDGFCARSYASP